MRLESTAKSDQYNCWLTDDELEQLRRAAPTHRDDVIIQLGGYVGLRAFEIPQIQPRHIRRTDNGDHYRLRVPSGKDTTGNGGKPRDAFLPEAVEKALHRYQTRDGIDLDASIIGLKERGVRAVVKRTAERAAEQTGNDDFQYVSSHDLRRRFAQRLLVDHQMNPRVVMAVGGWESFQAIEPSLNAPSAEVVDEAFEAAGLA